MPRGPIKIALPAFLACTMLNAVSCTNSLEHSPSISQRFNRYYAFNNSTYADDRPHFYNIMVNQYTRIFADEQNRGNLKSFNNKDVRLLFRAASMAAFYAQFIGSEAQITNDMTKDLAELERRHITTKSDYSDMYKTLVTNREFSDARALRLVHLVNEFPPLPTYRDEIIEVHSEITTQLVVDTKARTLTRRPVDLHKGAQIVVLVDPLCHFCHNFLVDMQSHKKLLHLLNKHAVWITPPNGVFEFNTLQQWDRQHPNMRLGIVYKAPEWPMIKEWAVPTFYFLQNGTVATVVQGWPKGGNTAALKKAMQKIGLSP